MSMVSLKHHPTVFRLLAPRRERAPYERRVIRPLDDTLIEGFPRSANTYAVEAFRLLQNRQCAIGNHFHNPAQFALAERYGLPAMLLLREPEGAVVSFAAYQATGVRPALQAYIRFHAPLLRRMRSFVVAPFEEVTSDFSRSIARLNACFGCDFAHRPLSDADDAQIREAIHAKRARIAAARGQLPAATLTLPSADKADQQERLRTQYSQAPAALREQAQVLHARLHESARD